MHTIYPLVYVDDITLTGSSTSLIQQLTDRLNTAFSLKQLGHLDYFLDLEIKYLSNNSILMTQSKYIRDVLHKTNMAEAHSISSPMVSDCKLSRHGVDAFHDPNLYRSVVGALQYATFTRPKINFAVNKVCQFMVVSLDSHWTVVKRILRYLKGTLSHGLLLQPTSISKPLIIRAFCDADWTSDVDDRHSTSGTAIFLGPNLISWWSRKQKITVRSSTEAEYGSIAQTSTKLT